MSVRRHVIGGVEETSDASAPYGSRLWCIAMLRTTVRDKHDATTKASTFRFDLLSLRDNNRWKELSDADGELFSSWEDFCQYPGPFGLDLDLRQVEAVLAETDDKVTAAAVLARVGRPRKGEGKGSERNLNPLGRSSAYNLARLHRDRPDLAARVEAGELSPHAAALEAGFRKLRDT
jgi:hypothetical protein